MVLYEFVCAVWRGGGLQEAARATPMWGRCGRAMGARGVVVVVGW